jgi:hypothetical protein
MTGTYMYGNVLHRFAEPREPAGPSQKHLTAVPTRELVAPEFLALTAGIVVFFVGVLVTQRVAFLRRYNTRPPGSCS